MALISLGDVVGCSESAADAIHQLGKQVALMGGTQDRSSIPTAGAEPIDEAGEQIA